MTRASMTVVYHGMASISIDIQWCVPFGERLLWLSDNGCYLELEVATSVDPCELGVLDVFSNFILLLGSKNEGAPMFFAITAKYSFLFLLQLNTLDSLA